MEQLNSGDNSLELCDNQQGWIPLKEAFLTEATEYKLRYAGDRINVSIQGIPLPFYQQDFMLYATFITPFQSGSLKVIINGLEYETYIYPDTRKLTDNQFNLMIEEVLEEANICFQLSGLEMNVNAFGRNRDVSWTQWSYIDRSFNQLRQIFTRIQKQPFRRLEKLPIMLNSEKIQRVEQVTISWLDQKGHGRDIPKNVQTVKTYETWNVYENQVLKKQVHDLYLHLRKYEMVKRDDVARKAKKYKSIVQSWKTSPFLDDITEHQGAYTVTQKFRKHPVYRLWYQWFDRLYKHDLEGIGFDYPIALKNTFELYEMWCFMKIVKILRESSFLRDTRKLFFTTLDGIFLNLAENAESRIELNSGVFLYFQRSYQYNSKRYHTFTQKMIPDIVLEGEDELIVFDPKYRIPNNLGTALGEMHKYRDGIIHRDTGKRAVQEVYILTPTREEHAESMRYFQEDFHETYSMGAIQMLPGVEDHYLKTKIEACIKRIQH